MASSESNSNQTPSSNSQSQGGRAGAKWSDEEETWLVINSMRDVTIAWLTENFPGRTRGKNGISGHLNDMRLRSHLSRKWRNKTWEDEPAYTMREDVEIMQWHVGGRRHVDTEIFVPNQRAGGSVIARADYLCQDEELVRRVKEAEEAAQAALEARDEASYNVEHPTDDDPADHDALGEATRILHREEDENMVTICEAISRSLAARGEHHEDEGRDVDKEDSEDNDS
ncbi:uncharacterized protein GIQ15_05535 [Arthroderma uncinatum]|uniref:uncharacterized protein n=1 Tax=Arthroderma uncinatum TaxID=74035 RepID=UPI00144AED89|nr:uncharacterized protein GIQ15_05535 [Arthroderma uncinatum]KAF3480188.1 hypothetical protein GIQ15_05535 [Arthroderma uncinatum]